MSGDSAGLMRLITVRCQMQEGGGHRPGSRAGAAQHMWCPDLRASHSVTMSLAQKIHTLHWPFNVYTNPHTHSLWYLLISCSSGGSGSEWWVWWWWWARCYRLACVQLTGAGCPGSCQHSDTTLRLRDRLRLRRLERRRRNQIMGDTGHWRWS